MTHLDIPASLHIEEARAKGTSGAGLEGTSQPGLEQSKLRQSKSPGPSQKTTDLAFAYILRPESLADAMYPGYSGHSSASPTLAPWQSVKPKILDARMTSQPYLREFCRVFQMRSLEGNWELGLRTSTQRVHCCRKCSGDCKVVKMAILMVLFPCFHVSRN